MFQKKVEEKWDGQKYMIVRKCIKSIVMKKFFFIPMISDQFFRGLSIDPILIFLFQYMLF